MKRLTLLLSVFGTALLLGFSGTTPQGQTTESLFRASSATGLYGVTGVRAEYRDLSGNWPHTDTEVHIVNTNATTPLTLREVFVLGPNGVQSVIAIYRGLLNKIVPPLGQVNLHINSGIPGVVPQTSPSTPLPTSSSRARMESPPWPLKLPRSPLAPPIAPLSMCRIW